MNWKQYVLSPCAKILYHIFISIQMILFLVFIVNLNYRAPIKPSPKLRPYSNFIVLGQFNYPSNNVSTWKRSWSKFVNPNRIIIAAPKAQNENPEFNTSQTKYMLYKGDRGYVSPYINIANVLRENDDATGILYVHDDMLLTSSVLRKIGGREWIATNDVNAGKFAIYENSTSESVENAPTWWGHWQGCLVAFLKMFKDQRLKPYKHKSSDQNSFINVKQGASDMLYAYLPREYKRPFLNLLDLFAEHNLFLECAIPTAVSMMQEKFSIRLQNIPLCTDWGQLRNKPKEMIEKCTKEDLVHEAYHPIKISSNRDWAQYFDDISGL